MFRNMFLMCKWFKCSALRTSGLKFLGLGKKKKGGGGRGRKVSVKIEKQVTFGDSGPVFRCVFHDLTSRAGGGLSLTQLQEDISGPGIWGLENNGFFLVSSEWVVEEHVPERTLGGPRGPVPALRVQPGGSDRGPVHPLLCKTWAWPASHGTKQAWARPARTFRAALTASSRVSNSSSPSLALHTGASPQVEEAGSAPVSPSEEVPTALRFYYNLICRDKD